MNELIPVEERNYGIDIFRFISMFMVVVLHVLGHGGILHNGNSYMDNFLIYSLETLCIVAVNCFALISGYVNYGKKFSIKKLLNLWLQCFFINAIISFVFVVFKNEGWSIKNLLSILFPVGSGVYWYFTSYFILFLLMPFLNIIIDKGNKTTVGATLLFLSVLIGVTSCFNQGRWEIFNLNSGYSVLWIGYLFLVGAFIKKYKVKIKRFGNKAYPYLILYFLFSFMSLSVSEFLRYINPATIPLFSYTYIFNIINSCLLLLFFANLKVKKNKFILLLSATSFGVYLIHEQPFIRKYFLSKRFSWLCSHNMLVIYTVVILSAIATYLICMALEFVRQKMFKIVKVNKLTAFVDHVCEKIINKFNLRDEIKK